MSKSSSRRNAQWSSSCRSLQFQECESSRSSNPCTLKSSKHVSTTLVLWRWTLCKVRDVALVVGLRALVTPPELIVSHKFGMLGASICEVKQNTTRKCSVRTSKQSQHMQKCMFGMEMGHAGLPLSSLPGECHWKVPPSFSSSSLGQFPCTVSLRTSRLAVSNLDTCEAICNWTPRFTTATCDFAKGEPTFPTILWGGLPSRHKWWLTYFDSLGPELTIKWPLLPSLFLQTGTQITTTFTCSWVHVSVQFHYYQINSPERQITCGSMAFSSNSSTGPFTLTKKNRCCTKAPCRPWDHKCLMWRHEQGCSPAMRRRWRWCPPWSATGKRLGCSFLPDQWSLLGYICFLVRQDDGRLPAGRCWESLRDESRRPSFGPNALVRKTREGCNCLSKKPPTKKAVTRCRAVSTQGSRQVCLSCCPKC